MCIKNGVDTLQQVLTGDFMLGLSLILCSISVGLASEPTPSLYHVVQTGSVMGYVYTENDKDIFVRPHVYSIGMENIHLFYC